MSERDIVNELHKPARKNFSRRKVIMKGIDDLWQADLVEMRSYASDKKGYHFLLTILDTLSKYGWVWPLKTKTVMEVTLAIKSIFDKGRVPKNLQTVDGKEFFNRKFQNLMQQFNMNHYSSFSSLKASIVERFNRTLKGMMRKEFSFHGSFKWIDIYRSLIDQYNNNYHRTIKMKPIEVCKIDD